MLAAVIDLDWLGWTTVSDSAELMWRNLAAVWRNYADAGVEYVVMARLIQDRSELDAIHRAIPDAVVTVVRVDSSPALVAARLRGRDSGRILEEHLRQSGEFASVVASLGVEDLVIDNGDRAVREVALEVLGLIGWT